MQSVRTGYVARVVAMLFLLWTGVDLINPSVCAIDRQAGSQSAVTGSMAITGAESTRHTSSGSAEDCFCCCQHIVSAHARAPISGSTFAHYLTARPVEHVRVFHTHLDRPPRFV